MPQIDQLEINAKINAILNRWPAVGLALGVVRDGALEFSCHGIANIESAIPVTEDTVFRIGSITKTFTAVAVMQLWEQGLIDLDVPANDYLRIPPSAREGRLAPCHDPASADPHRRRAGVAAPVTHDQQRLVRGDLPS
jgi:CubicO group peptidase (beta-lactamase class C family)